MLSSATRLLQSCSRFNEFLSFSIFTDKCSPIFADCRTIIIAYNETNCIAIIRSYYFTYNNSHAGTNYISFISANYYPNSNPYENTVNSSFLSADTIANHSTHFESHFVAIIDAFHRKSFSKAKCVS